MMPLAYLRPGLVLHVWQDGQPMVQVTLTRRHAFTLPRDLASALAENDDQP
jgi:hypothetical protein